MRNVIAVIHECNLCNGLLEWTTDEDNRLDHCSGPLLVDIKGLFIGFLVGKRTIG